jgi:hypothetical protein
MRNTGLSSSIGLVALGAILAWAVSYEIEGIDLNTVGIILFAVGILGIVVTLVATATTQRTVIERNREVVMRPDPSHQESAHAADELANTPR